MRYLLLPFVLGACGTHSVTDAAIQTTGAAASRISSASFEHSVTGSGVQKIGPGFEYAVEVSARSDASGHVTGMLLTRIIDLSAYGYAGKAVIESSVTCMRVVDNTAYLNAVVTKSTDPLLAPVGSRSVFWVRDGGASAPDVAHGGPGDAFDPGNLICSSTPPALPADPVTSGNFEVR